METTTSTTPRVYIACLAAYNSGILHGAWCDAIDADEVREAIKEVLATSPVDGAEEYAFHDYDGFGSMTDGLGEYPGIDYLCELGSWLNEAYEPEAVLTFLGNDSFSSIDDAKEAFEESYLGETTLEEYAEQLIDECYNIPAQIARYIDYEKFARNLSYDGYWEENGYVFGPY
jgi:antirestriction protein